MPTVHIRKAGPDDASSISMVRMASWRTAYAGILPDDYLSQINLCADTDRFEKAISIGDESFFVVENKNGVIGFCVLGTCRDADIRHKSSLEIYDMHIFPQYWRCGIGRMLYQHIEKLISSQSIDTLVLWVLADNLRGRRFYEAVGFSRDVAQKYLTSGESVRAVRYIKKL